MRTVWRLWWRQDVVARFSGFWGAVPSSSRRRYGVQGLSRRQGVMLRSFGRRDDVPRLSWRQDSVPRSSERRGTVPPKIITLLVIHFHYHMWTVATTYYCPAGDTAAEHCDLWETHLGGSRQENLTKWRYNEGAYGGYILVSHYPITRFTVTIKHKVKTLYTINIKAHRALLHHTHFELCTYPERSSGGKDMSVSLNDATTTGTVWVTFWSATLPHESCHSGQGS